MRQHIQSQSAQISLAELDDVVVDRADEESDALIDPAGCSLVERFDNLGLPTWYHADGDPVVGKALRLIENNPAHGWTVASPAAEVGMSRAALARRFTDLVGEPPMAFLTEWRLALAADLLRESDATIETIARQVGYSTAFALSTAFKRHYGISPKAHRIGA